MRIIKKKNNKDNDYCLKDIEKMLKPEITTLIAGTLTLLVPYGNMILKIINNENDGLLIISLLVFPSLLLLFAFWNWYIKKCKRYKREAKELYDEINKVIQ